MHIGYGYYGMAYMDMGYMLLVGISLVLGLITQGYIKRTYAKWSRVDASIEGTGADAARAMLSYGGIGDLAIRHIAGELTDNYNPREKALYLSDDNYRGGSVASVAVACHEAGHAIQDAKGYWPMKLRHAMVPVVTLASNGWYLLLILGAILNISGLVTLAIIVFAATVVFQIVTLPVEFDASRRAVRYLSEHSGAIDTKGAREVLIAAALTYVASALISILNLLYIISRTRSRN